ncbi:UDP-N-acetylmuramoyl-tripeptide--D-alanyl-D-alanine ligase [Ferviditalea candida]|uniref:UDP-N-acetylmuramoyl-tripeptide--D-alanyl-D-alanine ligase n=1 Tax=Ferviditalea candida TaxID=3108399 RepID=A0ABU5ZDQ8_9BACL|nr:UDP-N-acetylmuramoyl-tripeptide--D-alanyl-D-alanine ligase [Paenibacillaceae bacterium T2]
MINRSFLQIAQMIGSQIPEGEYQVLMIHGVSTDSRKLEQGNLFVPIAGERFDGHLFVEEAFARGAAAALWQSDHGTPPEGRPILVVDDTIRGLQTLAWRYREQLSARIVGITGSNGKTTTKDMIASILSTTYNVHKTEGNLNNHIGLPLTLLQMDEDTEMAVLEMGMSGRGEIELLSRLAQPEAAVITNIGESHLLQLGSREEIAKAKLEIVRGMKADGLLVYNGDEPLLSRLLDNSEEATLSDESQAASEDRIVLPPELKTFRFGRSVRNDFYPSGIMIDSEQHRTYFTLNVPNSANYVLPLLGQHNVINALAAIAVSKYMGVSEADIVRGLKSLKTTGMRIEIVKGITGLTILNDAYNASPTSMKAAIELLGEMKGYAKKIAVLGDMLELGKDEEEFHREIGRLLDPRNIDYIFTYGRLAESIAEEAAKRFEPGRVHAAEHKSDIAKRIASIASPGDLVLAKASRGMKFEEIVNELADISI